MTPARALRPLRRSPARASSRPPFRLLATLVIAVATWLGAPALACAQYAGRRIVVVHRPRYLDPKLAAGATLEIAGGASVAAGLIWLGTNDRTSCAMHEPCDEPLGSVGAAIGLGVGGLVAVATGIGISAASSPLKPSFHQLDATVGTAITFTGLCVAVLAGTTAAMGYLEWRWDPDIASGLAMMPVAGGLCGLGIPLWVAGMRPSHERVEARQERSGAREREGFVAQSPAMRNLGIAVLVSGIVLVPAGMAFTYAAAKRHQQGDDPWDMGPFTGAVAGALPGAMLIVPGSFLLARGGEFVPPSWAVSLRPRLELAPGGVALTMDLPF